MIPKRRAAASTFVAAIVIVGIAAFAAVVLVLISSSQGAKTVTVTPGATNSCSSYSTNTTVNTSVTISGASQGAAVQVVSDSGSPIAGIEVRGQTVEQCEVTGVWSATTNSTGWIREGTPLGAFNLTVSYMGHNYTATAPQYPMQLTVVTIHVPSGLWTVDIGGGSRFNGGAGPINGPSYSSSPSGSPQLKITLGSSSISEGDNLPIQVSFLGAKAADANFAWITMQVTNSQGSIVGNFSQRVPDLYFLSGAQNLRGFTSYDSWNAATHPPQFDVPISPGAYRVSISTEIDGEVLTASGQFQVTS